MRAIAPKTSRCTTGVGPQTFDFATSHPDGVSHIERIDAMFSIAGDDYDGAGGPDAGAQGCHFAYFPKSQVIYLDGPTGGSTWGGGNSAVGTGGIDLTNGFCTIHAGWAPALPTVPYISPFILESRLVIEFPQSSSSSQKKHIYTFVYDDANPQRVSGDTWKYWGWWATQ